MAIAAPLVDQGAVSGSVARSPERSPLALPASAVASAIEPTTAAPLISLSDVTPSTADILLITLNSDLGPSDSITQLDSSQNLVITSIANEDFTQNTTALLLSPTESVSASNSDDVFYAPSPIPTAARLTELRNVRHAQQTYANPPSPQLILRPDDIQVPVSHVKPSNDNSLLKALISRPCMKIPSTNIMSSIQIPIIRPIKSKSRTPVRKQTKPSARAASDITSTPTSHAQTVAITTLTTDTITSYAVTSAVSFYPTAGSVTYVTTASLITIPLTTLSYATTKTYSPCTPVTHKTHVPTPMLVPLTTPAVTTLASSRSPAKATSTTAVVTSSSRLIPTATVTSLTTTITNTNVKLVSTDDHLTTATREIDTQMRVTYATKIPNPPPIAILSRAATAFVAGTAPKASNVPCLDTQFLEPSPVKKLRTAPAARTFSGPRKVTVNQRSSGNVPQRVIIRHANPRALVEKMLKTPAPLHKIADAAVTRLNDEPEIIHEDAPQSEPLLTPTSTISFATSTSGTTHTLIVPHYKDTVFKNLSSIAYADPARLGSSRCPTERIVIRRPVAYFSPRRSFSCASGAGSAATTEHSAAQRTIIRAVPVSLADNPRPQHVLRTEFLNLPHSVLTATTVPDNILADPTSLITRPTPNVITTTT